MCEPALGVQMPADVRERDKPGVALRDIKPIPHPRIGGNVGLPTQPDVHAVERVKQHRQEDNAPLYKRPEWNGLQVSRNLVVLRGVYESRAIRPKVFCQKCPNGKYAGKGMKLSEKITCVRLACRFRHPLSAAGFLAGSHSTSRQSEENRG